MKECLACYSISSVEDLRFLEFFIVKKKRKKEKSNVGSCFHPVVVAYDYNHKAWAAEAKGS